MLGCIQPMSSPMMNRMLGLLAAPGGSLREHRQCRERGISAKTQGNLESFRTAHASDALRLSESRATPVDRPNRSGVCLTDYLTLVQIGGRASSVQRRATESSSSSFENGLRSRRTPPASRALAASSGWSPAVMKTAARRSARPAAGRALRSRRAPACADREARNRDGARERLEKSSPDANAVTS